MGLSKETRAAWIAEQLRADATGEFPAEASATEREELLRELQELRALWSDLAEADAPLVAESPRENQVREFHRRLTDARRVSAKRFLRLAPAAWLAAAAAVLVVGFVLWRVPRSTGPQESFASSASSATRLEAVLAHSPPGTSRSREVSELVRTLHQDPSPAVRLAALDVLAERHGRADLEGRLGQALADEADPMVRVTLIRTIGELRLVADAPALRTLAAKKELDPIERREIARALSGLSL